MLQMLEIQIIDVFGIQIVSGNVVAKCKEEKKLEKKKHQLRCYNMTVTLLHRFVEEISLLAFY